MANEGEAGDDRDPLLELFGPEDEDEAPSRGPTWLDALGQMTCAVLLVLGAIVAFIAAAIVLRRVWP